MIAAIAEIPKPKKGFELDHLDEIERLVREQEKTPKGRKKQS